MLDFMYVFLSVSEEDKFVLCCEAGVGKSFSFLSCSGYCRLYVEHWQRRKYTEKERLPFMHSSIQGDAFREKN